MNAVNKEALQKYIALEMQEVNSFVEGIDLESVESAKQLILSAQANKNRVHVTGIGKPGHVAGYAASLLSSTGTPTYELHGTEAVHGSSGQVLPGDVVIAISNSGETKELQATVVTLKKNGAKIIAVTGNKNSWLAANADTALIAGVKQEGDTLNKPPRASILAEIIILQALSVSLQYEKQLNLEEYVKWHPGGAIGQSINEGR
jgi:D-arabinose 5-phosphate isomerase GutQ